MPRKKKEEIKEKITKEKFIPAVGRRKRSVARIKLYKGVGINKVNERPIEEYFPGLIAKIGYQKPFELTQTLGKFYAWARIEGGGKSSQLGAFVHGVSRALAKVDPKYKEVLKKAKFLTRDPREKERRKPGFAQKARAKKQSPKR